MSSDLMMLVVILAGIAATLVGVVANALGRIFRDRGREQSRREIAAYVAEGSMSAEEGARLMAVGESRPKSC